MRLFDLEVEDVTKVDRRAFLVIFVLGALVLISFAANMLPVTVEIRLGLLVLQQTLFCIAGLVGTPRKALKLPPGSAFAWGLIAGLGIHMVNRLTGVLSQGIAAELFGNEVVKNLMLRESGSAEILLTSDKPLIFFGVVLLLTIGAPLGEELFFRGLLLSLWKDRYGAKKAVFFSALTFALLHFYVLQFIPVLVAGVLLGILFVHSKNIVVSIIAHSTVNSLVLVFWLLNL